MARWKLSSTHYLNVPGVEWEHSETDLFSGRLNRKRYPVPMYLDPKDPIDCNGRRRDELIVCHEGKGERLDIIFVGDPTPDMVPLDDEAEEISHSLAGRWVHPIESLPETQSMLPAEIEVAGMADLVKAMTDVQKQNQELVKVLVERRI